MNAPPIRGVLETVLYSDDLDRAREFYEKTMGLPVLFCDDRMCSLDAGSSGVLLVFRRGATLETVELPGGTIPPHDGHGPLHMAFSIDADALKPWEGHLAEAGIEIEGRTTWPRGGESIYFRDMDGHLIELATPGLWK